MDKVTKNNSNDMADTVLKGIGILAGAALLGVASNSAAKAYNTKRKYDAIDNGVNQFFGSIPVFGALFK